MPVMYVLLFSGLNELATQKLLIQGYVVPCLQSSLQNSYGRHHDLVDRFEISISQMTLVLFDFTCYFSFFYDQHDFMGSTAVVL